MCLSIKLPVLMLARQAFYRCRPLSQPLNSLWPSVTQSCRASGLSQLGLSYRTVSASHSHLHREDQCAKSLCFQSPWIPVWSLENVQKPFLSQLSKGLEISLCLILWSTSSSGPKGSPFLGFPQTSALAAVIAGR